MSHWEDAPEKSNDTNYIAQLAFRCLGGPLEDMSCCPHNPLPSISRKKMDELMSVMLDSFLTSQTTPVCNVKFGYKTKNSVSYLPD